MLHPGSGTGQFAANSWKIIRFFRKGCTNRHFYHIVVTEKYKKLHDPVIEQLGTYDPFANEKNEILVSINYERLQYWLGNGADTTKPVRKLLGLAGFYPISPFSYVQAWRNRQSAEERALKESAEKDKASDEPPSSNG